MMESKPAVPIVFATDDRFAPYCGVSIASLIQNRDPNRKYELYIFYDDLSDSNRELLSGMATDNVTIECVCITDHVDRKLLYTHKRLSVATYYRFFVADVLPQYDKLLYLDSDIAILGDIGELFDIPIGNNLLGGIVIYRGYEHERALKEDYLKKMMDVSPDHYINAGILSINLKGFREQGVKEKCLAFMAENRELQWLDQDALNAVCKGQIEYLPDIWNLSQFYYETDYKAGKDVSGARIIHYLDRAKPWLVSYRISHLFFYQYAMFTPYLAELRATFHSINRKIVTNAKQEVLDMSGRTELGPRYFSRCLRAWAKARTKMLLRGERKQ